MRGDDELLAVFRGEVEEQLERLAQLLAKPPDSWDVETLFRLAHNVKGAARVVGVATVRDAAHALEDLFSMLRRGGARDDEVVEAARRGAELLATCFADPDERGQADVRSYRAYIDGLLEEDGARPATRPDTAGAGVADASPATDEAASARGEATETLRVGVSKLDALMALAADVTTSSQEANALSELASRLLLELRNLDRRVPGVRDDDAFKALSRTARRLRDEQGRNLAMQTRAATAMGSAVRSLRLVPVENLRVLLNRALREACSASRREADLAIEGGDTEVDRGILEALRDPLVHLVRNAVAHGIEAPEERRAAGKPERGSVKLRVRSSGSWVDLVLEDDGRGLDPEALREAARGRGLEAGSGDDDLLALLCSPGFTTRGSADEVAGRGVGLDVVRRRIELLDGELQLTNRPGKGMTLALRVPLTRLTTRCLLLRSSGREMVVPLANVERTLLVRRDAVRLADGRETVLVDDEPLPVTPLETPLSLEVRERKESRPAAVLADGRRRHAFLSDEVVGEVEVVLQPLPTHLGRVAGVAGCTVLRGEQVVPVLDVPALMEAAAGARASREAGQGDVRQRRVLVVDDSVTSRTLERNILASAGYDVRVAVNGREGWSAVREGRFDLVISDVDMPEMTGIELTRQIRGSRDTERLPVVLVTSLGDEEHKRRGAEAGADAYIVKGAFDQDELLRAVARLL